MSPATFSSLYYRGCACLELATKDDICNAIEDFNKALKIPHAKIDFNIYYKRAFAYELIGQYVQAIIDYTMYIQKSKNTPNVHKGYLSRGRVYGVMKNYRKALDDIKSAIEKCQQPSKYYMYCQARAMACLGCYDSAEKEFKQLAEMCRCECERSSGLFETYFYYGLALYELKHYSEAQQQFTEALKYCRTNREKVDATFYTGLTLNAQNKIGEAKEKMKDICKLDKNYTAALFGLGMLESEEDNLLSSSLSWLNRAHELSPHRTDILYVRGEVHYKMGQIGACVGDKQLAMQIEKQNTDPTAMKNCYEV